MIDSFKKAFGYILLYTPKYIPATQEVYNKEVRREPGSLEFIPDILKTQEMCNEAVRRKPRSLEFVPDHLKTQEMCNKVVEACPYHLKYVPDWFVTRERLCIWYDYSEYHDDDENTFFNWYEGYKKRKVQKAQIEKELMPVAWHPSR